MSNPTQKSISYAGSFERTMDAKNRVTIPAAWLNGGPDEFHAIPSTSGDYLIVMPSAEFDSMEERINASSQPRAIQQNAIRRFYGQSRAVSADSQGRILLPEEQCETLQLKGEIVLVGGRSRFEIWNPKRLEAVEADQITALHQVNEEISLF